MTFLFRLEALFFRALARVMDALSCGLWSEAFGPAWRAVKVETPRDEVLELYFAGEDVREALERAPDGGVVEANEVRWTPRQIKAIRKVLRDGNYP